MSVTNLIDDERIIIVQGINGICLHQENWMIEKQKKNKRVKNKNNNLQRDSNRDTLK